MCTGQRKLIFKAQLLLLLFIHKQTSMCIIYKYYKIIDNQLATLHPHYNQGPDASSSAKSLDRTRVDPRAKPHLFGLCLQLCSGPQQSVILSPWVNNSCDQELLQLPATYLKS